MSPKRKYYVVWKGRKVGVLNSWAACKSSVHGFKDAQHKSFDTLASAKKAFFRVRASPGARSTLVQPPPDLDSLSVDAACSGNPGRMEYRGVDTRTKKEIFKAGPFEQATNNIGEFLALVHGLARLNAKKEVTPIYSDSRTAISWVRDKTVRTAIKRTKSNRKVFELIERALKWLRENEFENPIIKWDTVAWGEIPADFGRK